MAGSKDRKRASLGNLMLVWRFAGRYPQQIAAALFFLILSSAATLAIPYGFKRVIDRGFGSGAASGEDLRKSARPEADIGRPGRSLAENAAGAVGEPRPATTPAAVDAHEQGCFHSAIHCAEPRSRAAIPSRRL